jgi:hypothetical protein
MSSTTSHAVPPELVLLDQEQAAEVLSVQPRTRESWRYLGNGPMFVKMGGRIRYKLHDLHAWVEERTFRSTTEVDNPL